MQTAHSLSFLRRVLLLDAVSCAAMGAALLALAPTLAVWFELPEALLRESGIVLLPFAAFVGYLASREQPARLGVALVIALNALWVIDSIALLFTNWVAPNAFGYAFVIGQAIVVAVLAELELIGMRKSSLALAR